jgi:hypothetical protein
MLEFGKKCPKQVVFQQKAAQLRVPCERVSPEMVKSLLRRTGP